MCHRDRCRCRRRKRRRCIPSQRRRRCCRGWCFSSHNFARRQTLGTFCEIRTQQTLKLCVRHKRHTVRHNFAQKPPRLVNPHRFARLECPRKNPEHQRIMDFRVFGRNGTRAPNEESASDAQRPSCDLSEHHKIALDFNAARDLGLR